MKRVTYTKVESKYEDHITRYDVALDGEVLGYVERYREETVVPYSGVTYGRPVQRTRWSAQYTVNGGRHPKHGRRLHFTESTTRIDAAADLVRFALGIVSVTDARQIVKQK